MSKHNSFFRLFLRNIVFAAAYFLGAFCILMIILNEIGSPNLLNETSLLNWDATHYQSISQGDYAGFLVAFFPLFPFLWKALHLGSVGITVFNSLIFVVSASALATVSKFSAKELLLLLSFPSLIFMFLPYSESLFFASSVLIIMGMTKENEGAIFIGMLMASLTRPVVYIFVPAILILFLFQKTKLSWAKSIIIYILPVLLGLFIVLLIQYINTGDFLAFFHAQELWGNGIRFPKFHFTSWGGNEITKFDGSALLVGMVATLILVFTFLKKLKGEEHDNNNVLMFSLLYLAAICWFVLFTRGGSLFSLNRFVYATPFFFIGFVSLIRRKWSIKQLVAIFFAINAFWLLMGSYVHIQQVLKYLSLTIFLMSFLFVSHPKKYIAIPAFCLCLIGNVSLQIYFYYDFLNKGWIG